MRRVRKVIDNVVAEFCKEQPGRLRLDARNRGQQINMALIRGLQFDQPLEDPLHTRLRLNGLPAFFLKLGKHDRGAYVVERLCDFLRACLVDSLVFPERLSEHFPAADVIYDGFHVLKHYGDDVLKETRQKQAWLMKTQMGKDSEDARERRWHLRSTSWNLLVPRDALEPKEREFLESVAQTNKLIGALLPMADMVTA